MNALVTENIQEMENSGRGWFTDKTTHIKTLRVKEKWNLHIQLVKALALSCWLLVPPVQN